MPRPKRTKVAPSGPAAHAKRGRGRPPAPSRKAREGSDDIEDSQRPQNEQVAEPARTRATRGGATVAPSKNAAPAPKANAAHARVLEESKERRDSAMARLEAENEPASDDEEDGNEAGQIPGAESSSSPEIEIGRRGRVVSSVGDSILVKGTGNFKRRARQQSILGRGRGMERSHSVESDLAQSQDITNIERPVGNVMSAFKRRQRQPSILGRAGNVRSSSLESERDVGTPANPGSALATGMFRRRARQASILGTPSHNPSNSLPGGDGDHLDDEDDFNPEDQSTPLNLPKSKALDDSATSTSSSANPRKRKLSPLPAPQSSPSLPPLERSPTPSLSPSPISSPAPQRPQTPEHPSSTHAPPHSSSSLAPSSSPPRPSHTTSIQPTRTPATRRQPSRAATAFSDDDLPSSPPSLTHSPDNRHVAPKPRGRPKASAKPPPANLSTVELQALLPRRRRRTVRERDMYEIGDSDDEELGSDDDELSHLTTLTTRTHRRTPAPTKRVTKLRSAVKGKGRAAAGAGEATDKRRRTYGSRSDKENGGSDEEGSEEELDPDHSLAPMQDSIEDLESSVLEQRVGKELKQAKKKFEDVDKWEMEFEEVTASSSSPRDAR